MPIPLAKPIICICLELIARFNYFAILPFYFLSNYSFHHIIMQQKIPQFEPNQTVGRIIALPPSIYMFKKHTSHNHFYFALKISEQNNRNYGSYNGLSRTLLTPYQHMSWRMLTMTFLQDHFHIITSSTCTKRRLS
ncbi:hypothetical protein LAA29_130199 [Leuconostoc carnosum]|nr:hypothetical protein LCAC16_150275 [Leuconostoc carnosum]SPO33455.1 hypothetical protein LAA29_130199 [Leuconostoc carnosum]